MIGKISIIGVGNVGASIAFELTIQDLVKTLVLIDIDRRVAHGKSLDLSHACAIHESSTNIFSTDSFSDIKDSDIIIVTAGVTRKDGMSRDDLILINSKIAKDVAKNIAKFSPNSIIIVVSNPLDIITHVVCKTGGFDRKKVFGMGSILDAGRMRAIICKKFNLFASEVKPCIIGVHGDDMLILPRFSFVKDKTLEEFCSHEEIEDIKNCTIKSGSQIIANLGTSAYYAPSAGVIVMIKALDSFENTNIVCSTYLDGEYNIHGVSIGTDCVLNKTGLIGIKEKKLNDFELAKLHESANKIKNILYKIT